MQHLSPWDLVTFHHCDVPAVTDKCMRGLFTFQQLTDSLILQSEHKEDVSAGPTLRDRSHIEDTLRLTTAEPSAEVSGEDQRHHLIDKRQYVISLLEMWWKGKRCPAYIHSYRHTYIQYTRSRPSHIESKSGCSVITLLCSPPFLPHEALHWNEKSCRMFTTTLSTGKKNRCVCMWMKGSLRQRFVGLFCWNYYLKIASWCPGPGAVMCDCVYCMRACVWACRHVSKRVINQSKSVTLSSPWKHLCSLEPHWFISERCCSGARVSKSPRLDSINFMRAIHHALPKQLF